jgi:hypothetical protein
MDFAPDEVAVCFYKAAGLLGRLIRWQTRSEIGHTATYLPRVSLGRWIEADVKKGVIWRHEERQDLVAVARVKLPTPDAAYAFALQSIGARYDKRMIARFLTRQREAKGTQDKFFCSEHTAGLLRAGGLHYLAHSQPWEESPGDLYLSPVLFPAG